MPANHLYRPGKYDSERWRLHPPRESRGGVIEDFVRAIEALGPDAGLRNVIGRRGEDSGGIAIHPDYLRVACFEALEAAGCHYRLYSPVVDVLAEDGRVLGVAVAAKEGRREYRARIVIDTTGDADVAHPAGAPTQKGRSAAGSGLRNRCHENGPPWNSAPHIGMSRPAAERTMSVRSMMPSHIN